MTESESDTIPFSFELVAYPHSVANDLHYYKQFYSEVEILFKENDKKLQVHISERLKDIPEGDQDEFIEGYGYDLHQNQSLFPSMHREAIFITLYNFLEHHLNQLCRKIGGELKSNISPSDLRGSGIERSLLYLKKIPEFSFEAINREISFIKNANKLRNHIVHKGGVLPNDEHDKVNKFVASKEYLDGKPGDVVIFKSGFIPSFIVVLQAFFKGIENEMQRYMDKYRT